MPIMVIEKRTGMRFSECSNVIYVLSDAKDYPALLYKSLCVLLHTVVNKSLHFSPCDFLFNTNSFIIIVSKCLC